MNGNGASDLLFSSGDEDEEQQLADLLKKFQPRNLKVVREAFLLRDTMAMPYVDTTSGEHIVGFEAIQEYFENQAVRSGA